MFYIFKTKAPQKCGANTKTQNIAMVQPEHKPTGVNILAFFNVVASSQISPHFPFGLQRYIKNLICK